MWDREQVLEAGEDTPGLAQWHPEHRAKAERAQDRCSACRRSPDSRTAPPRQSRE
jgi:hypothetical protein